MVAAKRAVALFLIAFGIAMAIAALADKNWVDQRDLDGLYGTYRIGLTEWEIVNSQNGNCPSYDLDNAGSPPCEWAPSLLGNQDDWKSAGQGALGIGAIAVIVLGFAGIFNLVNLCLPAFTKVPAALLAFFSGVAFFIGALVYEGMRPSWGGDMGYNHPMGLYLAAGLMAEIAAIVLWSADYTGAKA